LYDQLDAIDTELHAIHIPHGREEPPRSIREYTRWKGKLQKSGDKQRTYHLTAAELKYFCLYLSIPLLGRRLPREYASHWKLLVDSLLLLSSQSIPTNSYASARDMLSLFMVQMAVLYGPEAAGLEVHMLKHVVKQGIQKIQRYILNYDSGELRSPMGSRSIHI
jgi:hypothetical protein